MNTRISILLTALSLCLLFGQTAPLAAATADRPEASAAAKECVACHEQHTPGVVTDWRLSRHSEVDVGCADCHGDGHISTNDVSKVRIPTPDTCAECHETQVKQFKDGKHALAWAAMEAMPTIHWQPMAMTGGMKGCGGCHKIGLKSERRSRS